MRHTPELAVAVKEWLRTLYVAVVLIAPPLTQGRAGKQISRFRGSGTLLYRLAADGRVQV